VTQYFQGFTTNYQSLQVQLSRRFTHGIAYSSALTWGKAQNYQTGPQDGALLFYSGNLRRNYTLADFDRRLNFEQTLTWELPAGRNHKYFNSGISSYVLGGWKTSVILSALSGLPFTLTTTSATPGDRGSLRCLQPDQHTCLRSARNHLWLQFVWRHHLNPRQWRRQCQRRRRSTCPPGSCKDSLLTRSQVSDQRPCLLSARPTS